MSEQITIFHWSDGDVTYMPVTENHFEGQDPVEYICKGFKEGRGMHPEEGVRVVKVEWTNNPIVNDSKITLSEERAKEFATAMNNLTVRQAMSEF